MQKAKENLRDLAIIVIVVPVFIVMFAVDWIISAPRINKHKKVMKMKVMKVALEKAAKELCIPNNTFTTLELKLKLRKDEPNFYWTQKVVSDMMMDLETDGVMVVTADNGTYRTYSDPTIKVKVAKKASKKPTVVNATPLATVVKKSAPVKTGTPIGRAKALDLMENAKGKFFTVEFVSKKGDRVMNAQYIPGQGAPVLGYVKVRDIQLRRTQPNDCTRQVNLQTLKSLKIGGVLYKVK